MTAGWQVKPLGSVAVVFDGPHATPKTVNAGPIFLGIGALQDGTINLGETRHVTEADYRQWTRRVRPQADDVVFSYETRLGQAAVIPPDLTCCLGRRMGLVRFNTDAVLPPFFLYQYMAPAFQAFLESKTIRGATVDRISIKDFPSFPIAIPPRDEQRRIVAILDEAFDGITTAKANAEKNLQNARDLVGTGYQTIVGSFDQSQWGVAPVADLAAAGKGSMRTGPFGSQLLHSEFVDDGIAVLGIDNAVANEFRWDKRRYITEAKFRDLARYRVYPGDVLITIMGTCGRCAVVPDDIPLAINTKHLCCITLDREKCLPDYLHLYFLRDPLARAYLAAQAKGSIMAGLNMGIISALPVRLPPLDQQISIVERFNGLQAECDRLADVQTRKLAALDELRHSLLHQAFTGGPSPQNDQPFHALGLPMCTQ